MALLGEYLNTLAKQAGMSGEEPELKSLLSNTQISGYEIPEVIVQKLNGGLLTLESAKNNSEVKKHYFAQAYNGLDSELSGVFTELGISEEVKAELLLEKSSTKRASLLAKKVKEIESLKAGAGKGDKAELQKIIDGLNAQIITEKDTAKKTIEQKEGEYKESLKGFMIGNNLSKFTYSTDLAKEENYLLPKTKITNALKEKGLRVVIENENLKLETEAGTDYFENNTKVDFNSFLEKTLSNNKLLAVSNEPQGKTIPVSSNAKNGKSVSSVEAMMGQLEQYK
jgi:hypothetical protein